MLGGAVLALSFCFKLRESRRLHRAEQREMQVSFVKLVTRHGKLYCDPDATGECFGEFADLCEFTDFRYGPLLAPYFPTCKTED